MSNSNYGYGKQVHFNFEEAILKTKETLKHEGFGILTEIDMKTTLKNKIDKDIDNYTILGACHPPSAYQAVKSEDEIGLMLPCNVIVYQKNNEVFVSAIKPKIAMGMIANESLAEIATDVEQRLMTAIDNL